MSVENYWTKLQLRRVSRRRLLKSAAMGGTGLAGLGLLGCSSSSNNSVNNAAPTRQAAATTVTTAAATRAATPVTAATAAATRAATPGASPLAGGGTPAGATAAALQPLIDAAKKEGKLTFYSSNPQDQAEAQGKAFKDKYGVSVDVFRASSGPLGQKFAAEAGAGDVTADAVILADPVFMDQASEKGWLANLSALPSVPQWPKQFFSTTYAKVQLLPITIEYNKDKVKQADAPAQWQDLLKPMFKGQTLFVDPRNVPVWVAWMYFMREKYGDDFLRQLGKQDLRLAASAVPGTQQLAAGEAAILVPSNHQVILPLVGQGAPLADTLPEPSTGVEQLLGVAAKAPHPNAARLFVNWAMTAEGQAIFNKDVGSSPLPNIPGAVPLPKSYESPKIKEAVAVQDELLKLVGIQ